MRSTDILRRIRKLCLALPDTDEASPFGHPWFRVKEKMFVSFGEHEGTPCVVVKVGKEAMSLFLEDARFFRAPYIGQHGWVGLRLKRRSRLGGDRSSHPGELRKEPSGA